MLLGLGVMEPTAEPLGPRTALKLLDGTCMYLLGSAPAVLTWAPGGGGGGAPYLISLPSPFFPHLTSIHARVEAANHHSLAFYMPHTN